LGRVPRTYLRLADDASLPLALQDRLIREADALTPDNPFDVHTLAGSHLKWLVEPAAAARVLGSLAGLTGDGGRGGAGRSRVPFREVSYRSFSLPGTPPPVFR
jgi:hypothetical protein